MDFLTIPINLQTPGQYIEFDPSQASGGLAAQRMRLLLIGQRFANGTIAAAVPTKITSNAQARQAFGYGSMLATMCEVSRLTNSAVEMWAVALDDVTGGTKATGTVTITGPATGAGVLQLYVVGKRVSVPVSSGDTATTIATNTAAAVNANGLLPMTAVAAAGVVTLTVRHKGEVGNYLDVRANYNIGDKLPSGVAVEIVCPTGGTLNPDVGTAIAAIGAVQYLSMCMAYIDTDNVATMTAELATRWDGLHTDDGVCLVGVAGTMGDVDTFVSALNSPFLVSPGTQQSPTACYVLGAQSAMAYANKSGNNPARPMQTTVLPSVLPPSIADRLTREERNELLTDGGATVIWDDFGACHIERFVTTYKQNSDGVPDTAYHDIETIAKLSYIRYQVRVRFALRFPDYILAADGNYAAGLPIVTPKIATNELVGLFAELEAAGIIQNLAQFQADLVCEIDSDNSDQLNALLPPTLVGALRVFAGSVQFRN